METAVLTEGGMSGRISVVIQRKAERPGEGRLRLVFSVRGSVYEPAVQREAMMSPSTYGVTFLEPPTMKDTASDLFIVPLYLKASLQDIW